MIPMRKLCGSVLFSMLWVARAHAQTAADPMAVPNIQFLNCSTGICNPLGGGTVTTYVAGTTTPLATCASSALTGTACTTPNSNPIQLNSSGYNAAGSGNAGIWPLPTRCYKFLLKDSDGTTVWTVDNICNRAGILQATLAGPNGAASIGFQPTSGTVPITVALALNSTLIDAGYSTLPLACSAATSAGKALVITQSWSTGTGFTCGAPLIVVPGGVIIPANGQTDTFTVESAPLSTICDTSDGGHCSIIAPETFPQWFGATTSATTNTAANTEAVTSLQTNGGILRITPGHWNGSFLLPTYPKAVRILCGGEDSTILQAAAANTSIISADVTFPNQASSKHEVGNCSIQAHASGSTGSAIDIRGVDDSYFHDITYLTNANGTGNFAIGILCNDGETNHLVCYNNTIDRFRVVAQSGPTTGAVISGNAAANSLHKWVFRSNTTGMTTGINISAATAGGNYIEGFDCEGNSLATCLYPGSYTTSVGLHIEHDLAGITGNGGSLNVFIGSTLGAPVTCPNGEVGWTFVANQGEPPNTLAAGSCKGWSSQNGGVLFNAAIGSFFGGLRTVPYSRGAGGNFTTSIIANQASGLGAATYNYTVDVLNNVGETVGSTHAATISGGQAPGQVQIIISSPVVNGAAQYAIYGRDCPTTCGLIAIVPAVFSAETGIYTDDNSDSPDLSITPATRDSTGDLNVDGQANVNTCSPNCFDGEDMGSANNAIVETSPAAWRFGSSPFPQGLMIKIHLTHTLRAGGNTLTLDGNTNAIQSTWAIGTNIATAVSAGSIITLTYINRDPSPGVWQLQGQ